MNNITLFALFVFIAYTALGGVAHAQGVAGPENYGTVRVDANISYTPLEPLPGLEQAQSGTGNFGDLVQGFFRLLLNVGAFLAVTILVLGGITYMFSEKVFDKVVARSRIQAAFWGLAILALSWLLLRTLNPQLLELSSNLLNPADSGTLVTQRASQEEREAARIGALADKNEPILLEQIKGEAVKDNAGNPMTVRVDKPCSEAGVKTLDTFTSQCEGAGGSVGHKDLITPGFAMCVPGATEQTMPITWVCYSTP